MTSLKGLRDLSTANFQYAEWRKPSMPLRPVMVGRTGNSPRSHSRKILDNPASSRWPLRSSVNRRHGTTNWKTLDVTAWLIWFAQTVLTEQRVTHGRVGFFINKAHFYDWYRVRFNDRQAKMKVISLCAVSRVYVSSSSRGANWSLAVSRCLSVKSHSLRGIFDPEHAKHRQIAL